MTRLIRYPDPAVAIGIFHSVAMSLRGDAFINLLRL